MDDFVEGEMYCAKCSFRLSRRTISLDGGVGNGNNKTEPCPNGCGPLWPVTYRKLATEFGERIEEYFQELVILREAAKSGWLDMKDAPTDGRAILVYATDEAYATPGGDNWGFYICPARWDGRMWSGWPLNSHYWPKGWKPLEAIGKFNPEPLSKVKPVCGQ